KGIASAAATAPPAPTTSATTSPLAAPNAAGTAPRDNPGMPRRPSILIPFLASLLFGIVLTILISWGLATFVPQIGWMRTTFVQSVGPDRGVQVDLFHAFGSECRTWIWEDSFQSAQIPLLWRPIDRPASTRQSNLRHAPDFLQRWGRLPLLLAGDEHLPEGC